ncbi:MAG: small basic protein [Phycisphaerales bacterium]|nr:MAG: small basic protein [Phycisphaerales bacterium]
MSRDKTLKSANTLARHRNVLTRAERIEKLTDLGKWDEESSPLGLPKVAHRKVAVGGKAKKKKAAAEEGEKPQA